MLRSRFDRWLAAAGAVIALLVVVLSLNLRNSRELKEHTESVIHTHDVLDRLSLIDSHLREAEAAQRSFVILGGKEAPAEFEGSVAAAQAATNDALGLTTDNSEQQQRLTGIRAKISDLMDIWERTIAVRKTDGLEAAQALVAAGTSRQMMADLQAELQAAREVEDRLLIERDRVSERTYASAQLAGFVSGVLGIVAVVAFITLMRRHLAAREAASVQIAEQGERLRTTLASIGDAVISTDREGRITNLNAVAESLTGWKAAEAIGQPLENVFRIVNETTRAAAPNPAERALREGVIVGLANHTVLIGKDGTERPIDDSAAPIRCKEGEVVGCVLVFRDITERRKLERDNAAKLLAARLLANIVENSNDAIVSKSLEGVIQTWNAGAERIFGYTAAEAVGQHISLVIPPDRLGEENSIIETLKQGRRVDHFDTWRVRKDGTQIQVSLTISPIFNDRGEVVGASKIARDVTRERQAAEREHQLLTVAARANTKFEAFFDQGAIFAALMSRDGTILEPNRFSCEGCGFTRQQIVGKPFWEGPWWSPSSELVDIVRQASQRAAAGETYRGELPYFVGDGSQRYAEFMIQPIRDESGQVLFLAPTGTDITERKLAEAERERFVTVVENSTDFIGMCDLQGVPFYINRAGLEMVGLGDLEDVSRVQLRDFFFPEDQPRIIDEFIPSVLRSGHGELEVRFRHFKAGEPLWVVYKVLVLTDEQNQAIGLATVSQNITRRRQMEDNLRTLASDLSEADRRKDEFLATLAHELRNPLAPIRNALQILRHSSDDDSREQARLMMERQLEQMVRLVDDLLDVSRITRGKLELRTSPVRLSAVINSALETSRPLIDRMQHVISVTQPDEDILVEADLTRLAQVFSNLLNNSAKYMDPGGHIWLTATREGDEVVVSVRDAGIGIAAEQLPHIFEMFAQADHSLERAQGGLGIGLTLVQRLVDMHHGRITASSPGRGQGATFTVRLPVLTSPAPVEAAPVDGETAGIAAQRRILIVDDNRDSANSLATLLKIMGNETRTAYDGQAAVEAAGAFRPDVMLLDIGLPKLNGYEACRAIREAPWGRDIVLIAVTGWGQDEDRRRSRDAGFDHHFVKPVSPKELTQLLSELGDGRAAT